MEQKYAEALPYLRKLHTEVFTGAQVRAQPA
jgi:hypothetical protein